MHPVIVVPPKAELEWFDTSTFQDTFADWLKRVREQEDVFMSYSSRAQSMADSVRRFLIDRLKLSVLDWNDLPSSRIIMDNIVEAERRTSCGIFLFTKDDEIQNGGVRQDVPRDNVVFEAGFFAGRKNPGSILIVHERGAKIPSDLGGFVYLELKKRTESASHLRTSKAGCDLN